MKEENRMRIIEKRLNEIEYLVRNTRMLVAVLVAICVIGFCGLSSLMDILISNVGIILLIMVAVGGVCYIILLVIEKRTGFKKKFSLDEDDMRRMLEEIESEKNNESS